MNTHSIPQTEQAGTPGRIRKSTRAGRRPVFAAVAALMGVVMLGGCVTNGNGTGMKQGAGTLIGAGLGGLVGSKVGGGRGQLAAVAAGALLGGFMGNEVGASLDRADQMYQQRAQSSALNKADWQPVSWSNPDSGNHGTITPTRTIQHSGTGQICREYQTTVTVGGREQQGYGTACQTADGDWRISS
ncbi:MAG: RT0821/Lpp0805 family surface protein [Rhodospirillales bacterium]